MSLSKKQKDFLKTIKNPKDIKNQKQQFKLQNKFDRSTLVFIGGVCSTKREEFERINGKGKTWMETTSKEVEEKFMEQMKIFCPANFEENSLTKESLRDLTEPKIKEALLNELDSYFELMKKEVVSGYDYKQILYLIEIVLNKLLHLTNPELAVEKFNSRKTTDPKPLEFDLPKKYIDSFENRTNVLEDMIKETKTYFDKLLKEMKETTMIYIK